MLRLKSKEASVGRLKIDLKQGLLEVEGEDAFVREIYEDFRVALQEASVKKPVLEGKTDPQAQIAQAQAQNGKKKKPGTAARESYGMNKDLDLYGNSGKMSLKEFYASKSPTSNLERNVVFVYYLRKILEKDQVNLDDIYTCYKTLEGAPPGALRQSVADTSSSRYGWIDAGDFDDISIPLRGETFVDTGLPKAAAKKAGEVA
jgi:hypothetical protein